MYDIWLDERIRTEKDLKKYLFEKPFRHISVDDFLRGEKADFIFEALSKQKYYLEDHDLYQFERTVDFKNIKDKKLEEIRNFFLNPSFIQLMENTFEVRLARQKIDLHSLKLLDTHYLLCHDDQVEGRKIAFILNLSKEWKEKDGGILELFESKGGEPTDVGERIIPKFNQFNAFLVSQKSFHQISEVIGKKERVSISGWYYEDK